MSASVMLSAPAMSLTALGLRSVGVSSGAVRRCLVALVVIGRLLPVACAHHPAIWSAVTISRKRSRVRDGLERGPSREGYKEPTRNGKRTGPIDYACAFLAGVATLRGCSPFPRGGASRCRSWAIFDNRSKTAQSPQPAETDHGPRHAVRRATAPILRPGGLMARRSRSFAPPVATRAPASIVFCRAALAPGPPPPAGSPRPAPKPPTPPHP